MSGRRRRAEACYRASSAPSRRQDEKIRYNPHALTGLKRSGSSRCHIKTVSHQERDWREKMATAPLLKSQTPQESPVFPDYNHEGGNSRLFRRVDWAFPPPREPEIADMPAFPSVTPQKKGVVQFLSFDFEEVYGDGFYSPSGESSLSEERGNPDCETFDFALVRKSPPLADARPSRCAGG